jgi:adenosylhomocysteine nucleosidase
MTKIMSVPVQGTSEDAMSMLQYVHDFGGKKVLFVMASPSEYGPHLQAMFNPLIIGPVEAAVVVSAVLADLSLRGALPDLVVSLGSAGSAKLVQTEIYQAVSVGYRDMDASALGYAKGQTPSADFPIIIPLPYHVPGIASASLSTGANIVTGSAYDDIDADMVDMESFAILRTCQRFAVPLIGLRGISDGDETVKQVSDWTRYLHIIDEKLAQSVRLIEAALLQGNLVKTTGHPDPGLYKADLERTVPLTVKSGD